MKKLIAVMAVMPMISGAALTQSGSAWADCHEAEPPCEIWWNKAPPGTVFHFPIVPADDGSAYIVDLNNRIWSCKGDVCHPASLADIAQ
ncbi:MAG: hypothetical protein OXO52_22340 [Rhodospirillales bacterium]|nr:hypothetical protein [Rhodospirillales bacterium]MDE0381288.1 hypothetical protein [Rhodospirillales bacterium]